MPDFSACFRPLGSRTELAQEISQYVASGEPLSVDFPSGAIAEFEGLLCERFKRRYTLTFNSGTSALQAAYFALRLPPGSSIAVPVYTYPATVIPMLAWGLVPNFCDVDSSTANLRVDELERALREGARAAVVTHMWGLPAEMSAIRTLTQRYNVPLVADCSHAPGASYRGEPVSAFCDIAVFSFQDLKLVSAGEGGALLTDDARLHSRAAVLGHAQVRLQHLPADPELSGWRPLGFGLKLRMHPLAALIGKHSLQTLDAIVERQRALAALLDRATREGGLIPPAQGADSLRCYYAYKPVCARTTDRECIVRALRERGIPARIPDTKPLVRYDAFTPGWSDLFRITLPAQARDYPGADFYFGNTITIPFPNWASDVDGAELASAIREAISEALCSSR